MDYHIYFQNFFVFLKDIVTAILNDLYILPHTNPTHLTNFFSFCDGFIPMFFTETCHFQVFIGNRLVLVLCTEVALYPQKL